MNNTISGKRTNREFSNETISLFESLKTPPSEFRQSMIKNGISGQSFNEELKT
jgi:hypothetical protein